MRVLRIQIGSNYLIALNLEGRHEGTTKWASDCRVRIISLLLKTPAHVSAGFYERLHHIQLMQLGDWDGATWILEEANRRAPWRRPSEQRAHQTLADTHYDHIFFADYELRRRAAETAREHIAPKN